MKGYLYSIFHGPFSSTGVYSGNVGILAFRAGKNEISSRLFELSVEMLVQYRSIVTQQEQLVSKYMTTFFYMSENIYLYISFSVCLFLSKPASIFSSRSNKYGQNHFWYLNIKLVYWFPWGLG